MKKNVLILGCSHSGGSYRHEDPKLCDISKGWVALIANTFTDCDIYCVSHFGGGIFNYMWTLGYFIDKLGKDFFHKIIIQISNEPRLSLYKNPRHFNILDPTTNQLTFNDIREELIQIKKSASDIFSRNLYVYDIDHPINKIYNEETENFFDDKNLYLTLMIEHFLTLIKSIYDDSMLFAFRWGKFPLSYLPDYLHEVLDSKNKWKKIFPFLIETSVCEHLIETIGEKQYLLLQMTDNSGHLDEEGNQLVYKYLEPQLESFLN